MESSQKIKFSMYKSVARCFNTNADIVNSLPALKAAAGLFSDTITLIANATRKKEEVITGLAITKQKSGEALISDAFTLAGHLYAYAELTVNHALKAKVEYSSSDFQRLKDGELTAVCRIILDLAWQNLSALAAFNVTAEALEAFGSKITTHEEIEQDPRNAVSVRKAYNKEMRELFKRCDTILKNQIDRIMRAFKVTNPNFYNAYTSNRIIIDAPTTRTQIKGKVTNALTNAPVYGATIEIVETKQTTTTAPDGNYIFKPMASGTYNVNASKEGFKSQTITVVVVKRGKITKAHFKLVAD